MNNNCITTYTGRHIDPLHPDPDMICIEDIAHALSLICRGNGQVKTFFSMGKKAIQFQVFLFCFLESPYRIIYCNMNFRCFPFLGFI